MRGVSCLGGVLNINTLGVELRRGSSNKRLVHLRDYVFIILNRGFPFLGWKPPNVGEVAPN